jgi:lysophospholipase L1-like esterase
MRRIIRRELVQRQIANLPGVYNFTLNNNRVILAAIDKMKQGLLSPKVGCAGDSLTAGYNGSTFTGELRIAWPFKASAALDAAGIASTADSLFANSNDTNGYVLGTNWVADSSVTDLGTSAFRNTTTADVTNVVTITPATRNFDAVEVTHIVNSWLCHL